MRGPRARERTVRRAPRSIVVSRPAARRGARGLAHMTVLPGDRDHRPAQGHRPRDEDERREDWPFLLREALEPGEIEGRDVGEGDALSKNRGKLRRMPRDPFDMRGVHTPLALNPRVL